MLQPLRHAAPQLTGSYMSDGQDGVPPDITEKSCIACGEPIALSATLCRQCKSDQSSWRNELRYWASTAGIFALIASGATFTANLGTQIWQRLFRSEISITNLDPFGATTAWNLTNSPIYLRTINVNAVSPRNDLVWEVHQTIPANETVRIDLLRVAKESWYGLPGELFGQTPAEYIHPDATLFGELIHSRHTAEYVPTFLKPDSESFVQLKRFVQTDFPTFECQAKVTFVRLSDGSSGSIDVPCRGAFRARRAQSFPDRPTRP